MHAFHMPTMRTRDAVCASVRRHQHVSRVLYLQDMSIDVYGRKEEDDAPQEEAASSNGVRALASYTMDPIRCYIHKGHAMCVPSCFICQPDISAECRRHSSRHQKRKMTMMMDWTTCSLSD